MRQRFFVRHDAKVNLPCIGLKGDVQRQTMNDDGQRVKAQKLCPSQVQGHRRARHVGNHQVGHHGQAAGNTAFAIGVKRHFGRPTDQPRCQQGRVIGRQQTLEALHRCFDLASRSHDGVHALDRVGQVRTQLDQAHADLVAQAGGVWPAACRIACVVICAQ